jgi:hypothetical protein
MFMQAYDGAVAAREALHLLGLLLLVQLVFEHLLAQRALHFVQTHRRKE